VKIAAALQSVQRLYIETAPFIYFIETHPTYIKRMNTVIEAVENNPIEAFSSVITLTEVLNQPLKMGNEMLAQAYRDILINSGGYQLIPVNTIIAEAAADLRARYSLRTPDALHVASAINAACDAFLTNDMSIKRVTELPILSLDELEP